MSSVDIAILVIIAISVIYGVYRGFLRTIISVACVLLSLLLAVMFGPTVSRGVQNWQGLTNTLANYTDAVTRVGDVTVARQQVSQLDQSQIEQVIKSVSLPEALGKLLRTNLNTKAFLTEGLNTVNEYVSRTVVQTALNILSYIAVFILSNIALHLILGLIANVEKMPLLKTMDFLAGGLFGLARGAVIVYVLFLGVPILSTVLPGDMMETVLNDSVLAGLFTSDGFFADVVRRFL